jgi:S1-C subfamily serine protease
LPQALAQEIVIGDVLIHDSEEGSAYLGVRLEEETEHDEGGARVSHVVSGSPAEKAGFEEGDIVVGFDEAVIRGPVALTEKIHSRKPGEEVSITVLRNGRKEKLSVTLADRREQFGLFGFADNDAWIDAQEDVRKRMKELGERLGEQYADPDYWKRFVPDDESDYRFYSAPEVFSLWSKPKLGVQLVEATPELREHLGAPKEAGVLVSKVLAGTPAERHGVAVGDLIVSVEGEPVASPDDLVESLSDKVGKTFSIDVVRDGRTISLEITIPDPSSDRPTGPRA